MRILCIVFVIMYKLTWNFFKPICISYNNLKEALFRIWYLAVRLQMCNQLNAYLPKPLFFLVHIRMHSDYQMCFQNYVIIYHFRKEGKREDKRER